MTFNLTNHAQTRLPQRNLKPEDIALVLKLGTETRDGVLMTKKDVRAAVDELKGDISRVERLLNTYVVTEGEDLITAYRPGRTKLKNVIRSARTN